MDKKVTQKTWADTKKVKNIATGETSQAITSRHFSSLLFTFMSILTSLALNQLKGKYNTHTHIQQLNISLHFSSLLTLTSTALHWCYKTEYDSYWFQWEQICEYIRKIKMTICIVSDWNIFVTMEVIMRDWRDKDWQLKTYCCAFWLWELLCCISMVIRALCPANNQIRPHVSHMMWLWHFFLWLSSISSCFFLGPCHRSTKQQREHAHYFCGRHDAQSHNGLQPWS